MTVQQETAAVNDTMQHENADEASGPSFSELGLDSRVLAVTEEMGYETPSPIQAQTIPLLATGRDVVGSPRPEPARLQRSRCRR